MGGREELREGGREGMKSRERGWEGGVDEGKERRNEE